jgi:hypothetical protein
MLITDLTYAIDSVRFAGESLGFEPDPWQEKVLRYAGIRLIMNCARQSGKSMTAAIKAYHKAKYYSGSLTLLLSPSLRQSSELFRKILNFTSVDRNAPRKIEDSKLFMTLQNKSRIVSLPGKEGTVRGYSGADLIIIDEAAQVLDELYMTVRPMLAVSGGSLILLSTPFGKRGFFFNEWENGGSVWERYMTTASKEYLPDEVLQKLTPPKKGVITDECKRIPRWFLQEEMEKLPESWFLQEYFCEFVETEDQAFRHDEIEAAFSNVAKIKPLFGHDPVSDTIKPLFSEDS